MSTIENVVIENMEVKVKKPKAKSFAQKDKKTMYSIMGFLLNLKEQGILDDEKVMECLEALPLYKTAAEKTAFFQEEMFDTKKVEDELYKPMVIDYKKQKKENKQVKEKKPRAKKEVVEGEGEGEVKEKKPRAKKEVVEGEGEVKEKKPRAKKEVVEVEGEVKEKKPRAKKEVVEVEGEVKEKKPRAKKEVEEGSKRGRKPKQQIVELAQDTSVSVEEEGLDMLIQSMNQVENNPVPNQLILEDINIEDVDNMLNELEAEEIPELEPVLERVNTPILKEKKTHSVSVPVKKTKKNSVKIVENK